MKNNKLDPRDAKWTILELFPLTGIILILGGGILIQLAFFSESFKYNAIYYSLIGLFALLIGLYCVFAYRNYREKNAEKSPEGSPIFLVILGTLGTFLGIGSIIIGSIFSESSTYNASYYIWIGFFALICGLYCALAYRKLNTKKGNKSSGGGFIFLGILGIIGTFLGVIMLVGGAKYSFSTFSLIGIWSVVIIEFFAAILLIFFGTKYFDNYIRKKNAA